MHIRTSISLPEPMLKAAKKNAKRQHRTFSSYITSLIDADRQQSERDLRQAKKDSE